MSTGTSKVDQLRQMREAQYEQTEANVADTGERRVDDLYVHPFNLEIYGEPDAGLAESLDNFGLQHPIKVDPDGGILSGARRWTAAKELGWETIRVEVPDLDYSDETTVQKYVLLANAYRKQKTSYVQKKEADAYYRLLNEGKITKDELRSTMRQKHDTRNSVPGGSDPDADTPSHLAARAAGLHPRTYRHYRYVTDEDGAEKEIDVARESGEIKPQQASALKRHLGDEAQRVKSDEMGVRTASQNARRRLREAKVDHTYTEEQKRLRDAQEAATEANRKGKSFLNALARLKSENHTDHLDERHALMLANTVAEIVEYMGEFTSDEHTDEGRVEVGHRRELKAV